MTKDEAVEGVVEAARGWVNETSVREAAEALWDAAQAAMPCYRNYWNDGIERHSPQDCIQAAEFARVLCPAHEAQRKANA